MTNDHGDKARASGFVTVLAWIIISFAGLVAVSLLLQLIVWSVLFSLPHFLPQGTGDAERVLRFFLLVLFAFSVFVLLTAIALLKRREWARRAFIALFGLLIGLNLLSLVPFLLAAFSGSASTSGDSDQFQTLVTVMIIPAAVFAIGMSVLFGWLIRRLTSRYVRREFAGGVAT